MVILKEKVIEKKMDQEKIEIFEEKIIKITGGKIDLSSYEEIILIILNKVFFDVDKEEKNYKDEISKELLNIIKLIFYLAKTEFSVTSKFPEHIILKASILFGLLDGDLKKELKILKKLFREDSKEINECRKTIRKIVSSECEEEEEELIDIDFSNYIKFEKM